MRLEFCKSPRPTRVQKWRIFPPNWAADKSLMDDFPAFLQNPNHIPRHHLRLGTGQQLLNMVCVRSVRRESYQFLVHRDLIGDVAEQEEEAALFLRQRIKADLGQRDAIDIDHAGHSGCCLRQTQSLARSGCNISAKQLCSLLQVSDVDEDEDDEATRERALAMVMAECVEEVDGHGGARAGAGRPRKGEDEGNNQPCSTSLISDSPRYGTADHWRARLARDAKDTIDPETGEGAPPPAAPLSDQR